MFNIKKKSAYMDNKPKLQTMPSPIQALIHYFYIPIISLSK